MSSRQPDILTDKKERSDFFIALFVILIAGIFITQTSLVNLFGSDEASDTSEVVASTATLDAEEPETDIAEVSEVVHPEAPKAQAVSPIHMDDRTIILSENVSSQSSSIAQTDSEIDYSEATTATESIKEVTTEAAADLKSKLASTGTAVKDNVSDFTSEVQEKANNITDEVTSSSKNTTANLEVTQTEKKTEQERKNVLTSAITESDKKDCIIAIGLYRDPQNIKKLSNRLKQEGYDVFSKGIKSMTQVGVYISCDPIISQSVLSEIREIYARDAFIVE